MRDLNEQIRTYVDDTADALTLDDVRGFGESSRALGGTARRDRTMRRGVVGLVAAALVVLGVVVAAVVVSWQPGGRRVTTGSSPPTGMPGASWKPIAEVPAELKNRFVGLGDAPQGVSAGADVYFLNGHDLGDGVGLIAARYSPSSDVWTVLPRAPIPQRANVIAIWTGHDLIVWGGNLASGAGAPDGAAFDPSTNQWRRIADAPIGGTNASAALWSGTEIIVWGAGLESGSQVAGVAYNPATDRWRQLADAPIANRPYPSAVWTGTEMIVWGGCAPNPPSNPGPCDHHAGNEPTDGAAYNPTTNAWRQLPPSPLPPRARPSAVWTGTEMIIWGSDVGPSPATKVGASYSTSTNSWRFLPSAPISPLRDFTMLWTGKEAVIVGGQGSNQQEGQRAAYHPDTHTWSLLPAAAFAWTGSAFAWSDHGLVGLAGSQSDWAGALLTP
jgi:hypothetical protein